MLLKIIMYDIIKTIIVHKEEYLMKKFVSILLASAVSMSCAFTAFAESTFPDVSGDYAWAYDYVEDMAAKGLISGYEDGTYRPGNSVSRMEAFALFARLMGSNSEINKDILELAKTEYKDVLKDYDLSYAEGDVAYMLMKGVITVDELDTYFKDTKKSTAMPRYEAAILITKAMAAEKAATDEVLIDMDYSDVTDIPKDARQYVYYVSESGIMSGMGDGTFSPNTGVNRGQVAVMLSKCHDAMNYSFESVKILGIDTNAKNIEIRDVDGKKDTIGYSDDTRFTYSGKVCAASDIKEGSNAILTYCEDDGKIKIAFADVTIAAAEEMMSVVFEGYTSVGGTLRITASDPVTKEKKGYDMSAVASISVDGIGATINDLDVGDYITIGLSSGVVVSVSTMQSSEQIKGAVVEEIDLFGTIKISHENDIYDGMTLPIDKNAKIYKNGDSVSLSKIYKGDSVTLELQYGLVSRISATSTSTTITGVLKEYTISSSPSLVIKTNGEEQRYDIPSDVIIVVNGSTGGKLAEIQIGANLKLVVESGVVKRIETVDTAGLVASATIKGVVTAVNAKANVIIVKYEEEGVESTAYINCNDSTKIYVLPTFSSSYLKEIKENDYVEAYGTSSNGIFVCTAITYAPSIQ